MHEDNLDTAPALPYEIRQEVRFAVGVMAVLLLVERLIAMVLSLYHGDEGPLLAFPLAVILPTAIVGFLIQLPGTQSAEGALMRLGTIVQLLAIIALPNVALYLTLGLPVVFLLVELFTTRFPSFWRAAISAGLIKCSQ